MYPLQPDIAYIRERLYALRQAYPIVDGLMLVSTGGFTLASTFSKEDSVSRLAAVSRTLYLLAEDTCREFERGEILSVHLSFRRGMGGDDNAPSQVILRSVTEDTMLVMVLHAPASHPSHQSVTLTADVERMVGLIAHQILHEGTH
jgi:predicted regulator of Ras-like GTPase activity (Roadblock/LC7/MglB family)